MKRVRVLAVSTALLLCVPVTGWSQKLKDLVPGLFSPEVFLSDRGPTTGPNHTHHFQLTNDAGANALLNPVGHFLSAVAVTQAITTQLSGLPLGSSSGGFTYTFDEGLATFDRTSDSFGPSFAERALTNGKGKFSFGFNFLAANFDTMDGRSLEDGEIGLNLLHNDCCPVVNGQPVTGSRTTLTFEGDVVRSNLFLDLSAQSTILFMNYGLTDRFDVGIVVPINRVEINASNRVELIRLSTEVNPTIHLFSNANVPPGATVESPESMVISAAGSASGLGDLALRGKYNFYRTEGAGMAGGVEFRLPTGDEEDLLGLGTWQTKLTFIASGAMGRISPHVNVGYRFTGDPPESLTTVSVAPLVGVDAATNPANVASGQEQQFALDEIYDLAPNDFNYTFGFDWALTSRVTVAADILGRRLFDTGRLEDITIAHQFRVMPPGAPINHPADPGPDGTVNSINLEQVDVAPGSIDQIFAAVGGKFNIASTLLVSVNLLFTLNDQGLKAPVIPVFGIDYVF
jgi:hypothetical protein